MSRISSDVSTWSIYREVDLPAGSLSSGAIGWDIVSPRPATTGTNMLLAQAPDHNLP